VCLKCTLAYARTLRLRTSPKTRPRRAFGKRQSQLSPEQVKEFEDFVMWRLCELSAKYELPFQIPHGPGARIQGSNPMNLVDLIESNPRRIHSLSRRLSVGRRRNGGWIAQKNWRHVWIDSVWLPEFELFDRQARLPRMAGCLPLQPPHVGGDCNHAEGIYGATDSTVDVSLRCWLKR